MYAVARDPHRDKTDLMSGSPHLHHFQRTFPEVPFPYEMYSYETVYEILQPVPRPDLAGYGLFCFGSEEGRASPPFYHSHGFKKKSLYLC